MSGDDSSLSLSCMYRKKVSFLNYGEVAQMTVADFTGKECDGIIAK